MNFIKKKGCRICRALKEIWGRSKSGDGDKGGDKIKNNYLHLSNTKAEAECNLYITKHMINNIKYSAVFLEELY